MSVIIQGTQLREIALGRYLQGKTSDVTTDADGTYQLFTVAGGEVLITGLWGKVTTSITGASTWAVVVDPTTGDSTTIVTATDLGTTDSVAGTVLGFRDQGDGTIDFVKGGQALSGFVVTTGEIELLVATATANGIVDWYCTWIPLTAGATVVAATGAPS
jgi:hypothetical protein